MFLATCLSALLAAQSVGPLQEETVPLPSGETSIDRLLAHALATPDAAIDFWVVCAETFLPDSLDDIAEWTVSRSDRRGIGAEIRAQHQSGMDLFKLDASAMGATILAEDAFINAVKLRARGRDVTKILSHVRVVDASGDVSGHGQLDSTWNGEDYRDETGDQSVLNDGFNGNTGSRTDETLPVFVGVIEMADTTDNLHDHLGYRDTQNGPSRIKGFYQCNTTTCNPISSSTANLHHHSDTVTSIAVGCIDHNQDPNCNGTNNCSTLDAKKRGGMSPEAEVNFYLAFDPINVKVALEHAFDNGVDVVSMSSTLPDTIVHRCDLSANPDLLNNTIDLVTALGMVFVNSTGNEGPSSQCNMLYPSYRPDVLSVGALDTSDATKAYAATTMNPVSPEGFLPYTISGDSAPSHTSGIGLVAPGDRILAFYTTTNYTTTTERGTSFSAPTVAGGIANFIQSTVNWFPEIAHNAYKIRAAAYVSGDAYDGTTASARSFTQTSNVSGYGRYRVWSRIDADLGNSSWGVDKATISSMTPVSYIPEFGNAIPSGTKWFKLAAFWNETGAVDNAADIQVSVADTCGHSTVSDTSKNLTKRVVIQNPVGRCLKFVFTPVKLPSSRTVYFSWMRHENAQP